MRISDHRDRRMLGTALGVDRRTLAYWWDWWPEQFTQTPLWRAMCAQFIPLLPEAQILGECLLHPPLLHRLAQQRIQAGLPATPAGLENRKHIRVNAHAQRRPAHGNRWATSQGAQARQFGISQGLGIRVAQGRCRDGRILLGCRQDDPPSGPRFKHG